MKILLTQDIERVGRMGEVVEVAGGYARNYLIPRGMAVGVTRGRMKEIDEQRKVLEVKAARERERLMGLAEKVQGHKLEITTRCSATGKLFGSITNRQVAQAVLDATGEEIDRHKIHVDDRIRAVGTYHATVKLHPDVEVDLEFEVVGEGFVPEEPEPDESEIAAEQAAAAPEAPEAETAEGEAEAEGPPEAPESAGAGLEPDQV
ncbi:MAG: 50S ribosomal protein L9 [Actinobacteria bacterium]|nr:50S ribosomal protein L9 [Actinomycetota bacterium]MBU1943864.1 50S ribosomal protein L9 [Actinomycetota bacterium]MBU2687685.1 50S ribosomal protein L9 [Actinomycetota bacterium]